MNKNWNRLLLPFLTVAVLLTAVLGISAGQAKYIQQLPVGTVGLKVEVIPVEVTDLFYNGSGFYADPECTIPVAIGTDENGKQVLVAAKDNTVITRMSKFNEVDGAFNIWLKETYTTFGSETLEGDYTIRRYTDFTDTMIQVGTGSPTIAVTVDGSNDGGTASYWDAASKTTATKEISAQTATAPAITVSGGSLTLSGTVQNNTNSVGDGGGISVSGGTLNLTGTVKDNTATQGDGGGISLTGGSLTYNKDTATVEGNSAGGNGGGICYEYGEVNVGSLQNEFHNFVKDNSATGKGNDVYPFEKEVFAVLGTDGVLRFYESMDVPKEGDTTYAGHTIREVYTDFFDANPAQNHPWTTDSNNKYTIVAVEVVDEIYAPESTAGWFENIPYCKEIDLTNLDTSKTTDMEGMFSGCGALEKIIVGDDWQVDSTDDTADMFDGCTNLEGGAGTTYNSANSNDGDYAKVDGGTAHPGYLTYAYYALVFEPNYTPFDGDPAQYPDVQTSDRSGAFTVDTSSFQPTRNGYTFLGWSAAPGATTAEFAAGTTVSYTVTGQPPACGKLYAVWEEKKAQEIVLYVVQNYYNDCTQYYNLYGGYENGQGVQLIDLSQIDQSLLYTKSGGDSYKFRPQNVGKVLSAYANLQDTANHYTVYFDGYNGSYDDDDGTHMNGLDLSFTGSGSLTITQFYSQISSAWASKYWISVYNGPLTISNVTMVGGGTQLATESAPFLGNAISPITLKNVHFVNFKTGKNGAFNEDQPESNGYRVCYDIVAAGWSSLVGLLSAENVTFENCHTTGTGFLVDEYVRYCDHYIHANPDTISGGAGATSEILYTLDTTGTTGLTVQEKDGKSEMPASEHAQILITSDVAGMCMPSEFPIKVNEKEYIIRPYTYNASEGGITVTRNDDGSYLMTIPSLTLSTNANEEAGASNVIYVDVDAVFAYSVSTGTLEKVSASFYPIAPVDADYTFRLSPNFSKSSLTEVTININGASITKDQFAANGITLSDDSNPRVTISEATLKNKVNPDGGNTIVISAKAVQTPQYSIVAGTITGATLTAHADVYPDENDITDIVLTLEEGKPILETFVVKVNDAEYNLLDAATTGVTYSRFGNVFTITVPKSVMMTHLQETGNTITIDATAREPRTTITHTSVELPEQKDYTQNWVVRYTDHEKNPDGSYSTFIEVEEGFVLDHTIPIQVSITVDGNTYVTLLGNAATTGDVSFDPETGEVKISADYLAMFPDQDIAIDVAVRSVHRQINLTTASTVDNLTVSNTWMDIDEAEIFLVSLITTEGQDNQWVGEIGVTVSDTKNNSKDYTITRVESMDGYPHMSMYWIQDREEKLIFRGDKLIELLSEWNNTPTKWTSDDLTITFTSITHVDRPNAAESASFALFGPRYRATGKIIHKDETPPQAEQSTQEESHTIEFNWEGIDNTFDWVPEETDEDYYKPIPGRSYSITFLPSDAYTLPETMHVDIDGAAYTVYTDGQDHRTPNEDGTPLPTMPTFDPQEGVLTIPAELLTEETSLVTVTAEAVLPSGEEPDPEPDDLLAEGDASAFTPEEPQEIPTIELDWEDISSNLDWVPQETAEDCVLPIPGQDYVITFAPCEGYWLPESILVDIDGTEYLVYTDGLDHREPPAEGEPELPTMPTFDPAEGRLTIPAELLTENTALVTIAAEAVAVVEEPPAPTAESEPEAVE